MSKITLEAMQAASDAIKALPLSPTGVRMNLTTLGLCQGEAWDITLSATHDVEFVIPGPEGARVFPVFEGLAVSADNTLATGIVEVDWSDERVETFDLLVRDV